MNSVPVSGSSPRHYLTCGRHVSLLSPSVLVLHSALLKSTLQVRLEYPSVKICLLFSDSCTGVIDGGDNMTEHVSFYHMLSEVHGSVVM